MENVFGATQTADISLFFFTIGLLESFALSVLLRWHFIKFSKTFSNRHQLGGVFIPLSVTIFLIILVVKSSLALSLGLVGALSIVRFRTPIKEPEELIYLFIAIAIGLGVGAGQYTITALAVLAILAIMPVATRLSGKKSVEYNFFVDIDSTENPVDNSRQILEYMKLHAGAVNLTKLEIDGLSVRISANISLLDDKLLHQLNEDILLQYPSARCTFLDCKAIFV
jgi:hypothetical protein